MLQKMTAVNGDINGAGALLTWTEFCEHHAAVAADDFAHSFRIYIQEHSAYNYPNACQEFAEKYVEYFLEHFESQTILKHIVAGVSTPYNSPKKSPKMRAPILATRSHTFDSPITHTSGLEGGAFGGMDLDPLRDYTHDPNLKQNKSFFRKFSFRGVKSTINRPFRQLFKQHSDDVELSPSYSDSRGPKFKLWQGDRGRMTKMLVECKKEGLVHQLIGEDYNGLTKWEKCRLVLIKTTGGFMLEFYTPPKVSTKKLMIIEKSEGI